MFNVAVFNLKDVKKYIVAIILLIIIIIAMSKILKNVSATPIKTNILNKDLSQCMGMC